MVLSRVNAKLAFDHILDVVLGRDNESGLKKALLKEGYNEINDFCTLTKDVIDYLTYDTDEVENIRVTNGDKGKVLAFIDYIIYCDEVGEPIGDAWTSITPEDFDTFRTSTAYIARLRGPVTENGFPRATFNDKKRSPAEQFRQSIKKDQSLFPELLDEAYHDSWNRTFANQARAQGFENILNPNFVPADAEAAELFREQQKFMYTMLEVKVQTEEGKIIVRNHEDTFDAQTVYKLLCEHHLRSTKARIESSTILSFITSARYDPNSGQSALTFINFWCEKVRIYERQRKPFPEEQKRVMLENAVETVLELRNVKLFAETFDKQGNGIDDDVEFLPYLTVLKRAATNYDNARSKTTKSPRQALVHEFGTDHEGEYNVGYQDDFNIDTPISILQANVHDRQFRGSSSFSGQRRVSMPKERWLQLRDDTRAKWDTLDQSEKAIILGIGQSAHAHKSSNATFQKPTTSSRQVNLHDISAYDYLQLEDHTANVDTHDDTPDTQANLDETDQSNTTHESTILINAATSKIKLPPGDLRRVMSPSSARKVNWKVDFHQIVYSVSASKRSHAMSLIDRGANGGVAGNDVRVISKTFPHRKVDIQGIDNHQMNDIYIGDVGGVVETQNGPIIAIFRQYALHGKGSTIHSASQMEAHHLQVDDKSVIVKGAQSIVTPDGYYIPLVIHQGLARLPIRPYTDHEFDSLPHVFMTGDLDWDPSVLDHNPLSDTNWQQHIGTIAPDPLSSLYDAQGAYRHRVVNMSHVFMRPRGNSFDDNLDLCVFTAQHELPNPFASRDDYDNLDPHDDDPNDDSTMKDDARATPLPVAARDIHRKDPDYFKLRPYFGWLNVDIIKKTLQHTTQYARIPAGSLLKRVFKSSNPALNVHRRNEPVACDIVYSDTPAIDDGSKAAVIFTGTKTSVTDVYGISTDDQFVNTLEDNIRERGAPYRLASDRGSVIISERVTTLLRTLCISGWQSEPHQQQQNPAERRYQTIKNTANRILDRVGAPAYTWLLCLQYVCFLLNHTFNSTLHNVPLNALNGSTVDVSVLLRFHFYQKVYYMNPQQHFPSESRESVGYVVGISENVGPALCWKVLTCDTKQVIHRSVLRPHSDSDPNLRAMAGLFDGETPTTSPPVIQSPRDDNDFDQAAPAIIDYDDLIGRTFLMEPDEDGCIQRAKISKLVADHEDLLRQNPERIKYVCRVGKDSDEEILTYNQIMEHLSRADNDTVWKYKAIVDHQGPLSPSDADYKGCPYNVKVDWENGEMTYEPLNVIAADDPVTCAIYAKEKGLLDTPGWKRFRTIAKRQKKFTRMINQAKLRSFRSSPKYKYGFEVARSYDHGLRLDEQNGNTKWYDCVEVEMVQIDDYDTFEDWGHKSKAKPLPGYKKIRAHLVFDVKHDGRHKARLVADGHLTSPVLEGIFSGVVTLLGFRLVSFLADLNGLLLWATDVGNAYLEALTDEKVYIEAGPEFGARCGHLLRVHKALYGLRTSSGRWAERCGDVLREMGFVRCKAEQDIWMRHAGDCYEYVAVYVDDLALAMKDPQTFVDELKDKYKFKLKGTGPIKFHLGMDVTEEDDGQGKDGSCKKIHCVSPTKYIERILDNYKRMYGEYPKQNTSSPLIKGDHPELDDTEFLDDKGIEEYQSLIGSLQWLISIGRFDIMVAVMTMSSFRAAPRQGHLERVKKIFGYISKMRHGAIRIRTDEPDYSDLPHFEQDWARSVYGDVEEEIPHDAPVPLGKFVTTTSYVDANLFHCYSTGKAVTGIIHLVNQTPIEWYSKKQSTVETATYGSEFVASRTCVDQIFALRYTLRYLGVPLRDVSYMFGDNQSVVNSSMELHAKLHKRHTMLAYHRVRQAIASGVIRYHHIPGESNPADMMSKLWGYAQTWRHLRTLLFWKGDTAHIPE